MNKIPDGFQEGLGGSPSTVSLDGFQEGLPSLAPQQQKPPTSNTVSAASGEVRKHPVSVDEFVQQITPVAQRIAQKIGAPVEAIIGQLGLETGWGKSVIPGTNNYGNIKDTSGGGVAATDNMNGSRDRYRQYASAEDFADDYAKLVGTNPRYKGAVGAKDAQGFFTGLKQGGYAEDPNYVQSGVAASQTVAKVLRNQASTQQSKSALPDLSNVPKWGEIAASEKYAKLPDAEKLKLKNSYFDDWIAPHAAENGDNVDAVRAEFIGAPAKQGPGILDRAADAAKAVLRNMNPFASTPSVMEGVSQTERQANTDRFNLPISKETRAKLDYQYNSASPEQRIAMAKADGVAGMYFGELNKQYGLKDKASATNDVLIPSGTTDVADPRIEARTRQLMKDGTSFEAAQARAKTALQVGLAPGDELYGTANKSNFDFETQAKFEKLNPLVRGAVKGYEGFKQGSLGVFRAAADLVGAEDASRRFAAGSAESTRTTDAIGENKNYAANMFEGAVSSIAQQLPMLVGGALTGSEPIVLASMAVQSFGQEYSNGRDKGLSADKAAERAGLFAAFEVIGEKFGLGESLKGIQKTFSGAESKEIIAHMAKALASEVPGEMLTTTGQFVTDKVNSFGLNKEAGWSEYLSQMRDTVVQTVMQGGLMMASTGGVRAASDHLTSTGEREKLAEIHADAAKERALSKWENSPFRSVQSEQMDGRVEPTGTVDPTAAVQQVEPAYQSPQVSQSPQAHPTEQIADSIVRDLAEKAGLPVEMLLPAAEITQPVHAPVPTPVHQPTQQNAPQQADTQQDGLADHQQADQSPETREIALWIKAGDGTITESERAELSALQQQSGPALVQQSAQAPAQITTQPQQEQINELTPAQTQQTEAQGNEQQQVPTYAAAGANLQVEPAVDAVVLSAAGQQQIQATQPVQKPAKQRTLPDDLLGLLNALGGISSSLKSDIDQDAKGRPGLYRAAGRNVDEIGALMAEHGYIQPAEAHNSEVVLDMLRRAVGGERIMTAQGMENAQAREEELKHREMLAERASAIGINPANKSIARLETEIEAHAQSIEAMANMSDAQLAKAIKAAADAQKNSKTLKNRRTWQNLSDEKARRDQAALIERRQQEIAQRKAISEARHQARIKESAEAEQTIEEILNLFGSDSPSFRWLMDKFAELSQRETADQRKSGYDSLVRAARQAINKWNDDQSRIESVIQKSLEDGYGSTESPFGQSESVTGQVEPGNAKRSDRPGGLRSGDESNGSFSLEAPTEQSLAEKVAREGDQALADKQTADAQREGFTLDAQSAPESRSDSTADMFGGPSIEDFQKSQERASQQAGQSAGDDLFAQSATTEKSSDVQSQSNVHQEAQASTGNGSDHIRDATEMVNQERAAQENQPTRAETAEKHPETARAAQENSTAQRFPDVADIKNMHSGPGGMIEPRRIAEGKTLYREVGAGGLHDLLALDGQADVANFFVADNPDLALGQGGNKGVQVEFRPNSLSGSEHKKPGTGDSSGREYRVDIRAPRAVQSVTLKASDLARQRGIVRRVLASEFSRTDLPDGRIRFDRKGMDSGGPMFSRAESRTPPTTDVEGMRSTPVSKANKLAMVFSAIGKFEDAFQLETPQSKSMEDIAREIDQGIRVQKLNTYFPEEWGITNLPDTWEVFVAGQKVRSGTFMDDGKHVWIDVSRLQAGKDLGSVMYAIAAAYAHNNGKVFIGDPAGLSPVAFFRRLENMISSAIKYGTTDHLLPHSAQMNPEEFYAKEYPDFAKAVEGLGLQWKTGDSDFNLKQMLLTSYNAAKRFMPGIEDIEYDYASGGFRRVSDHARVDRADLKNLSRKDVGNGPEASKRYYAGGATAARAALVQTIQRAAGGEGWRGILAAVVHQLRGRRLDPALARIFYSKDAKAQEQIARELFGNPNPKSTVEQVTKELAGEGSLGPNIQIVQSALDLPPEERRQVFQSSSADIGLQAVFFPDSGKTYVIADNIEPGEALAALLHDGGVHAGMYGMIGERGINSLASQIKDWARNSEGTEEGRISALALSRIPEGTSSAHRNEEAVAYFITEAVKSGHGDPKPAKTNAIARWFARLWKMVESAIQKLGANPASLKVDDIVALARGALERVKSGEIDPRRADGTQEVRLESRASQYSPEQDAFRKKAGLGARPTIRQKIVRWVEGMKDGLSWAAFRQGALDQFHGIKLAEVATIGALPVEQSAYVTARLATGASSVMAGLLGHGQARWAANGQHLEKIEGTKGLLDILKPVEGQLDDFLGWMVATRASRLMKEGRENNFTQADIQAGLSLANGKEDLFKQVAKDFADFKRSVLDIAQQAGLIDPVGRKVWDHADWIPFYRQMQDDTTKAPGGKRGLSKQSSGIRQLKGGESAMNDPLENILLNFNHLIDASLKNNALRKVIGNVEGRSNSDEFLQSVGYGMQGAIIPRDQIKKQLIAAGTPQQMIDALPAEALYGMAKMWALHAPQGKDIIRVMENGKPHFYRVTDPLLLKAVTSFEPFNVPGLATMRAFKRLLTRSVTATPAFMARNFIRDSASSAILNRDRLNMLGAFRGIVKSFKEEGGFEQMLFAGASFAGGQADGADPEATASAMRRELRKKGFSAASTDEFMASILDKPIKIWDAYSHISESIENANREAMFEAAKKSGKSDTAAAFEALDLMDFRLRGSSAAYQLFADIIPFVNARVQGLYRLGRSDMKQVAVRGGLLLLIPSVFLALANAGNDDYEELPDWDKDTYWHFFIGGKHYRMPKPFEVGVMFGTIPERITRAALGNDSPKKLAARVWFNVADQFNLVQWPQFIKPAIEVAMNEDGFSKRAIETIADKGKIPSMRASYYTSDTMKALAGMLPAASDFTGLSPKRLEHLWNGYLGSVGSVALGISDFMVRRYQGVPFQESMRRDEYPLLGIFYRENPAKNSQYVEDLYKMAADSAELKKSFDAARKEGNSERAKQLLDDNKGKIKSADMLGHAASAMSASGKQIEAIRKNPDMTQDQKREKIDAVLKRRNEIAEKVSKQAIKAWGGSI